MNVPNEQRTAESADLPFRSRLRLPLIVAPMLHVSGLALVQAVCAAGAIGAFPTANCRDAAMLEHWLASLDLAAARAADAGQSVAPYCPNLIMRRDAAALQADIEALVAHRCELVITSVGSPRAVVPPLHDAGCQVFADVASMRHVEKAIADGVDGLVLLTAGAGGQTGWVNPFAFVRAVRAVWQGPLVLAGGIADGVALRAALTLGCDFAYMGTRFIATQESEAAQEYKTMLVEADLDDVTLTSAFTGLPTNFLVPSIRRSGLDLAALPSAPTVEQARALFSGEGAGGGQRWREIWSAGHTVSGVNGVPGAAELVATVAREYAASA